MQALYTETFETFLERNEQTAEWQAIVGLFQKFPRFTLGELDFDMYTLLRQKYDIFEIGSEDEQIFYHEFREKTNELLIKYVPKIKSAESLVPVYDTRVATLPFSVEIGYR